MKKKVLLAMSGGIDSSVTAYLLKEAGYKVIGAYMKLWKDNEDKSYFDNNFKEVKEIGDFLGIETQMIDLSKIFKEKVVKNFIKIYKNGDTPSPCISCNKHIKFGAMFDVMENLGCDFISTGHYVRCEKEKDRYVLKTGIDKTKDQSYFLYSLNYKVLSHVLFPIGEKIKTDIKEIGKKIGLGKIAEKKESSGICFINEDSYVHFLERHTPYLFKEGDIVFKGEIIGKHKGLPTYTIGQRRGILIGGFEKPVYVRKMDYKNNQLILDNDESLFEKELISKNFILTGSKKDVLSKSEINNLNKKKLHARIRHLGYLIECKLEIINDNNIKVKFKTKARAITKGQTVVIYNGEYVVGGGEIN